MKSFFLLLPVLIPLLAGVTLFLFPFRNGRSRDGFTSAAVLVNSFLIFLLILSRPAETLRLVSLTKTITLALRLDGLGVVFLALIGFLWPLASFYAYEYMEHEENLPRFFAFYTLSYGVTAGIALSANLITMYFFYELLTLVTVPLVAHAEDRRSMRAARQYILSHQTVDQLGSTVASSEAPADADAPQTISAEADDSSEPAMQRADPNQGVPFQRDDAKVGPNDPCPCGSGKKFKKCCGK